jgi:hypothetical protein
MTAAKRRGGTFDFGGSVFRRLAKASRYRYALSSKARTRMPVKMMEININNCVSKITSYSRVGGSKVHCFGSREHCLANEEHWVVKTTAS